MNHGRAKQDLHLLNASNKTLIAVDENLSFCWKIKSSKTQHNTNLPIRGINSREEKKAHSLKVFTILSLCITNNYCFTKKKDVVTFSDILAG